MTEEIESQLDFTVATEPSGVLTEREPDPRGEQWDEESEEFRAEREQWLSRANDNTESFEEFFKHIMRRPHDYGTVVWACLAAMKKAFHLVADHPVDGGFSGGQFFCLQWAVLKYVFHMHSNTGHMFLDYDWLLSPDQEENFTTIRPAIWRQIQKLAKGLLEDAESGKDMAPASMREHWRLIVAGIVPFGLKVGVDVEGEG